MTYKLDITALCNEPEIIDPHYLPGGAMLTFEVEGSRVFGMLYLPQGPGPHPVAMLLHGLPGIVRSEDIAQALRRAGMACLIFSYRGSWGSEGTWSYANCCADTLAAYEALCAPETVAKYRLDPEQFVVIGHSFGGLMAMLLAKQTKVKDIILMSPADAAKQWRLSMDSLDGEQKRIDRLNSLALSLKGTSGEKIWEHVANSLDSYDLMACIPFLKDKRFLIIGADFDNLLPLNLFFTPLVTALTEKFGADVSSLTLATGHNYNSHRLELVHSILVWLKQIGY